MKDILLKNSKVFNFNFKGCPFVAVMDWLFSKSYTSCQKLAYIFQNVGFLPKQNKMFRRRL